MKTVTLRRTRMGDQGTFGVLEVDDLQLKTGELPWRQNARFISCIPAGSYLCHMTHSPKFNRDTYELEGVPARDDCRIHVANLMGDTRLGYRAEVEGCIALGLSYGRFEGQDGVSASSAAVKQFEDHMQRQPFRLDIVDEYLETGAPAPSAVA